MNTTNTLDLELKKSPLLAKLTASLSQTIQPFLSLLCMTTLTVALVLSLALTWLP